MLWLEDKWGREKYQVNGHAGTLLWLLHVSQGHNVCGPHFMHFPLRTCYVRNGANNQMEKEAEQKK